MNKKFIYIASPYTIGDNFVNTQRQIKCANDLYDIGCIPISPLLNSVWCNMQKERDYDFWMKVDYSLIDKCDALVRLYGESKGADLEVQHAQEKGIPIFFGAFDEFFMDWLNK